jgi:hypothetical protein
MGVDRSVSGGTSQILVLPVWNVEMCLWVSVLFGKTEINHIDLVSTLSNAHEKVVGLDVPVDEVSRVNVFNSGDQLVGEEEDSLERELSVAKVEQIFEGWATIYQLVPGKQGGGACSRSRTMAL